MQTRSSPSVSALQSLAREANMHDFETLPKPLLYQRLQQQYNIERLQRASKRSGVKRRIEDEPGLELESCDPRERRRTRSGGVVPTSSSSSSSSGKTKGKEKAKAGKKRARTVDIDPILLLEIPKSAATFEFSRPNGTKVKYNLDTLIEYCLATGDFSEPETRLPFSDADLKKMDASAKTAKLGKPSVLAAKLDPSRFDEERFRRDAMNGLERCAGELVVEMLAVIENSDPEEGQMRLIMYLFPLFSDLHRQLRAADERYASQCMEHFVTFLHGPPNRPTVDKYGFLAIVLHFLNQVDAGETVDFGM